MAAHSAYDMFYKYKYIIVNLFFPHLGFWSGNFILIAHFPGHCLLVPLCVYPKLYCIQVGCKGYTYHGHVFLKKSPGLEVTIPSMPLRGMIRLDRNRNNTDLSLTNLFLIRA